MTEPTNNNLILFAALGAATLVALVALRPAPGPTTDEFTALQAEFTALQAEVGSLRTRVSELQARRGRMRGSVPGPSTRGSLSPATAARGDDPERRIRNRIRDRIAATAPGGATSVGAVSEAIEADPAVRDKITTLVRDELQAERDDRWQRRRTRREEQAAQRLDELTQEAALTSEQRDQLDTLLAGERDTVSELFRAAREDGSWSEAREQADALRLANDESARGLLEETQFEAWQTMRTEESDRRRR